MWVPVTSIRRVFCVLCCAGGKDRAQSGERLGLEVIMCDSGLVILSLLTLLGTFIAFQIIFNPFDYNCNNFDSDDVVQAITY